MDLSFGRYVASGLEMFQKARLDGCTIEQALLKVVRWALEATYFEDHQWGGRYETMWKCDGLGKFKNDKGNRAKCPQAFEAVWFPGDPPDICVVCGSGIRIERRYIPDSKTKNRQTLLRALIWYGLEQSADLDDGLKPYVFPDGTKAVELSGKLPLPWKASTGEDFVLAWNFDYLGEFGEELFIVDNKTTTKPLNEGYFAGFSPDTQFDTYALVATLAYPDMGIRGTMVDAVSISASGADFGRRPYYKTEQTLEEHFKDLGIWLGIANASAEMDYWPMNKRSCWLCPFKQVCSQDPRMRQGFLASNFKNQGRWDPTEER